MADLLFKIDLLNKRTGYDPELMSDMFEMFRVSYPEYFDLISGYIKSNNWKGVSEIAHRAKSSVAIMGMESIREEFAKMEALTMNGGSVENCQEWLTELERKVKLAVSQIDEYIKGI